MSVDSGELHEDHDEDQNQDIQTLTYIIPINPSQEELDKVNTEWKTDFKSTEWHVDDLDTKFLEMIMGFFERGGLYVGDHIEVEIKMSYCPENK